MRRERSLLTLVCAGLLLTPALPAAAHHDPNHLTFDIAFGEHADGRRPTKFAWAPDGERLAYLWHDAIGTALFVLDTTSGESQPLLRLVEEGTPGLTSVDDYRWSPDGTQLLLESGGDLFLLALDIDTPRRLTSDMSAADPKFSPDSATVAFVSDYDLHLLDLGSGSVRALTTGGEKNHLLNGVTDWLYWEELWGRDSTGFWWSPAGNKIAYYQFDEEQVPEYSLVDFTPQYPRVEPQKYPKAGEHNPAVRVAVLDLATGESTWLDTGEETDVYLARVAWLPHGEAVAVQRMNRDQNRIDLLRCDPAGGACTTLLTEELETWVNVTDDLAFLADGSFVWSSERTGWRRLFLFDAQGHELARLSPEGLAVTGLEAVVESEGYVLFSAYETSALGALHRQIYQRPLDGGGAIRLSPEGAWASAVTSPASGSFVLTTSDADTPASIEVRDAAGETLAQLPTLPPTDFDAAALPAWKFFTIPGPQGSRLPAALLEPGALDPTRSYPVVMYHYGGPASQVVRDAWGGQRNLWHKMMAQRGYGVLMVDNQASSFFGKLGADRSHRRFGTVNLAAQQAAVEYLASLPWADTDRVGLWGWSGGGSNTLYALLNSPGTWRAGVAGAPVTNWRLYDTIWTERYLDHPSDNPDGYTASSAVTYADQLADHLLIVHGTADDNVHPQNTIVMSRKLIDAGKPFDQAIYPRQKHGLRGKDSRHFYEKMTGFFDRHLGEPVE